MERASRVIGQLKLPFEAVDAEELARTAWGEAVGRKVAGHTRISKMVRTRLVVEVEDRIWQRQLFALTPHILGNLEKTLGPGVVEDLEFRIVPRRRGPERAQQAGGAAGDEADNIADPVLRGLYRASRKRARP